MGDAISSVAGSIGHGLGSVGNFLGDALGSVGGAVGHGLSWLGGEVGQGLKGVEHLFGGGGGTGQPVSETPGAVSAALAQSTPALSTAAVSPSPISVAPAGAAAFADSPSSNWFSASDVASGGDEPPWLKALGLSGTLPYADAVPGARGAIDSISGVGEPAATELVRSGGSGGGSNLLTGLLGKLIPAALTAGSVAKANQTPSEVKALADLANRQDLAGTALQNQAALAQVGKLPGGAQTTVDHGVEAMKARIRQNYAQLGLTGSTAETQDLAYADQAAIAQSFQIGQGMAQTGFQASAADLGVASDLYKAILDEKTARGTQLGDALAAFAAASTDYGEA